MFEQEHGQGIRLLTRGAAGDPHPHGCAGTLRVHERRDDFGRQSAERFRVAEKPGHADQKIASESPDLFGMLTEVREVVRDVIEVAQSHAPFQPPLNHFLAIAAKIELRAGPQESEHLVHMVRDWFDRGAAAGPAT